ncbi:MAG: A24 family peptidase [Candidatus Freyarchaeota archaeon]|nr:A24 family peptidase [Candidatus Freyarchaeota archaeon]
MATCLLLLGYAAVCDWRTRRVRNHVWLLMVVCGLIIAAARWIYTAELLVTCLSLVAAFLLSLLLYALKVFGGADAKALICTSLLIPVNVSPSLTPLFVLTVFTNTLLFLGAVYLLIFSFNLVQSPKRGNMFQGFESESVWRKLTILLTCIRVDVNLAKNNNHLYPLKSPVDKNSVRGERPIPLEEDSSGRNPDMFTAPPYSPRSAVLCYVSKPLLPIILASVIVSFFCEDLLLLLLNLF